MVIFWPAWALRRKLAARTDVFGGLIRLNTQIAKGRKGRSFF